MIADGACRGSGGRFSAGFDDLRSPFLHPADEFLLEPGFIVDDPKDPRQLVQTIENLLQNSKKIEWMGLNARRRAEDYFSYEQLSKSLIKALDSATLK